MPRQRIQPDTLTIGQLAKRWSVSTARVRGLVGSGLLVGAFCIPSVGRYGATIKIPISSVLRAEEEWGIVPKAERRTPPRIRSGVAVASKHFPELNLSLELSAESASSGSR